MIGGENEKGMYQIIIVFNVKKALAFELNPDGLKPRNA